MLDRNRHIFLLRTFILILIGVMGCGSQNIRFKDAEPVRYYNDIHPIPAPKAMKLKRFDYFVNALPPRPTIEPLKIPGNRYAKDVNSMDEVPASSWYIPRLGYDKISPEELVAGPIDHGHPLPSLTIIRVRNPYQNPRLFVYDRRHIYYLLKFDPLDYPCLETSTSFIVNRLFWGFGYHVPEDHLFYFKKNEIKIAPESNLTQKEVDDILNRIAPPVNGHYRSIASRILEGLPLGTTPEKGVRSDDPNDLFPHEDRRTLRGLKVFCAFTNMSNISPDNMLDMYVGEPGKGYLKHHLIDFDDAFGTFIAKNNRLWAGYNHLFGIKDIAKNLFTLGLDIEEWEKIKPTKWKSVGVFEATHFKPDDWKETYPYEPIRRSQPADDYWATKIIGALSYDHIKALVKAADYPETDIEEYMIQTLMKRRKKILEYFLARISPIEFEKNSSDSIFFKDMQKALLDDKFENRLYIIRFYNDKGNELCDELVLHSDSIHFNFSLNNEFIEKAKGYLRIDILVNNEKKIASAPVQFHFRRIKDKSIRLVGVVR